MKHNPFQFSTRVPVKIVAVGSPESGIIYLAKRDGITPNENPVDMQEAMQRQTTATLIFLQAVKNCAEKEGISQAQAREKIFPTASAAVESSAIVKAEDPADLYDYLEPEQAAKLIGLQEDARQIALQAATLFIQQRLAYPIVLTEEAAVKAGQLKIQPLRFQVAIGNQFLIDGITVEAAEAAGYDAETIAVKPLPRHLSAQTVGYLADVTGREKLGDANWTLEDTRNYLMEPQIEAIYQFYQQEIGMGAGSEAADDEGNSTNKLLPSPNRPTENPSTGAASTGGSKVTA